MSEALNQQVNLYQPILGAEARLFSARAIAVALGVLALSLAGFGFYGSYRTARIESAVARMTAQQAASIALAAAASGAALPSASLADLDTTAKQLSADIESRQRALNLIHGEGTSRAAGFAARLEALGRRQIDGVWLNTIIIEAGDSSLAVRGASTDPQLIPVYLAGLAEERAFAGVHFDKLVMRRAAAADGPARMLFDLDDFALPLPPREPPAPESVR